MPQPHTRPSLFGKRVLIVRQDRIGDCVLATGLPREIKRCWPDAEVGVLVRAATRPIFTHNPHVDVILTDDPTPQNRRRSFWSVVYRLWRRRFSHALMLLPQARVTYLVFWAGIPVRVGHGITLAHAVTATRPVMTRKSHPGRHEASYAMDLARAIGVRPVSEDPEIHLTAAERGAVAQRRQAWLGGATGAGNAAGSDQATASGAMPRPRLIGVHTTSGGSAPNLPPEVWSEVVARLARTDGVAVVVTDPGVTGPAASLPGVRYVPAGVSLREGIVNFAALDLLVSASTGPMHVAAALGVPTFSLFCPLANCEPALWGPRGNEARTLLPAPEFCRDRCPGDPHVCTFTGPGGLDAATVVARLLGGDGSP
jgi:ADP-heptose:LPS heptosyltransferase